MLMTKVITTIKKIAMLGKRELRYTEIDGEKKYDIRVWHGDKYEDGVRFSKDEIDQLYKGIKGGKFPFNIGNKTCVIVDDNYALSIVHNERTYVRPFASKKEMTTLFIVYVRTKGNLLEYSEDDSASDVTEETTKDTTEEITDNETKTEANAYEKFKKQFEAYRNEQPENRRKGYELTHNIVLEHIKEIIKTSDEYNKNAMQTWKNSGNMMRYCQDKMFENAEKCMNATNEEGVEMLCQFVDEYIGLDDKPKPQPKKSKPKKKG